MARPRSVDVVAKKRILELQKQGLGVNAIARQLKTEGLPGAASQVSGILKAAREAANGPKGAPPKKRTPSPPPTPTEAPAPPADASAARSLPVDPETRAARDELAEADAIHEKLRLRLHRLSERLDVELAQPEPNWTLIRQFLGTERQITADVIATRPPAIRKPEDDPANLEQARVVVATLRARVEAGRAARAGAAA